MVYSDDLRKAAYKARLHREGKISFDVYWDFLEKACEEKEIDTSVFLAINSFNRSVELEKEIDFSEATSQRKKLINELMNTLERDELEELVLRNNMHEYS